MSFIHTYRSDFRLNLKLAVPLMAGQLGQIAVNVADNIMVGQLGAEALAGVSLAVAINAIFVVLGMGLAFALPPLISEADGSGKKYRMTNLFGHSLAVNFSFAFISMILILGCLPFLDLLNQEPGVVAFAQDYLFYAALSLIPMMLFLTFRCYADGLSKTVPGMTAMIVGNIINVFMNYVLIFGAFGFPEMGVAGASLSSLISRVSMIAVIIVIIRYKSQLWQPIERLFNIQWKKILFRKLMYLGIPTALQMFFEISAFSGAAIIMGMVGAKELAAHQIALNLASITFLICTGLAMASTIRIGNQLGKRDPIGLIRAGHSMLIQVVFFMAISSLFFVLVRHELPKIYIDDPEVWNIAALLLIFAAIFQIPDGIQVTAISILRGYQDVSKPTFITFIAYFIIGLPLSYYTAILLEWGPKGVWFGLLTGLSISAIWLTRRYFLVSSVHVKRLES